MTDRMAVSMRGSPGAERVCGRPGPALARHSSLQGRGPTSGWGEPLNTRHWPHPRFPQSLVAPWDLPFPAPVTCFGTKAAHLLGCPPAPLQASPQLRPPASAHPSHLAVRLRVRAPQLEDRETPFPMITVTRNGDCVYIHIQRYSGTGWTLRMT